MFNPLAVEAKIRQSLWWGRAACTVDNHHSNNSGVMITDHLEAVYENVNAIFDHPPTGFYGKLFEMLPQLHLNKEEVREDLRIVALLHDIGKPVENRTEIIPHPLTGKPAHKRHGLVSLMAAIEIMGDDPELTSERRTHIYRTVELHDISYGLFREYNATGDIPLNERWNYINNKIHAFNGAGILYLLIFKLADIHGHSNITDVTWFYHTVKENYFNNLPLDLPIPIEADIRR